MKKEEKLAEEMASWESSEIRFALNKYDDIFSDFDPRPVPLKGFSDDFLSEAKRASVVKEEKIDFIFMMPKEERNLKEEARIEDRLKKYFKKHLDILEKEKNKMIKEGVIFTIIGMALMMVATYLLFKFKNESLWANFFVILFEPAGWFVFWHGLDNVIFEPRDINPDLDFHRKMANATIKFTSV